MSWFLAVVYVLIVIPIMYECYHEDSDSLEEMVGKYTLAALWPFVVMAVFVGMICSVYFEIYCDISDKIDRDLDI